MDKKLPNVPAPREALENPAMHDISKARDERCIPIAQMVIRKIANQSDIPLGAHIKQKTAEDHYLQTIRDVIEELSNKNIPIDDLIYIFGLVRGAIEIVQEGVMDTVNENMNRITEAVYGLDHGKSHNVSVGDLAKVVKHGLEIKDTWKEALNK